MFTSGSNLSLLLALTVVTVAVVTFAGPGEAANIPPPHCHPDVSEALPPRLRRICAALYGMAEISNAVEQYLDEKTVREGMMPEGDRGVKRQDVDHVFLRFGRR